MTDHNDFLDKLRANERELLKLALTEAGVLPTLIPGLVSYFVDHIPTGGFLRAVLENDLLEAHLRADPDSLANLPAITRAMCDCDFDQSSLGSKEKVAAWLKETAVHS